MVHAEHAKADVVIVSAILRASVEALFRMLQDKIEELRAAGRLPYFLRCPTRFKRGQYFRLLVPSESFERLAELAAACLLQGAKTPRYAAWCRA